MSTTKTRKNLTAHENLLVDVIKRQAGTLEKALLEGLMNAVDANATRVDVSYYEDNGKTYLTIVDNGRGIKTNKEIEENFAQFGTPHTEENAPIYGRFRMGRGQMFAFGVNTWRTGSFKMQVDIEKDGLEYELEEGLTEIQGCRIKIELYHKPYENVNHFKKMVQDQMRFMPIEMYFNEELISTPVDQAQWDYEDDNAYYLFNAGTNMSVYNIGAYTRSYDDWQFGMNGIIVTKKQLKVNFARNDIQHDCTVWHQIKKVIEKNRIKKTVSRSARLTHGEKINLLQQILYGNESVSDNNSRSLVATTSRKSYSLQQIANLNIPWSFGEPNSIIADKLMQSSQAVIFNKHLLTDLGYTGHPHNFFKWLMSGQSSHDSRYMDNTIDLYKDVHELYDNLSEDFVLLADKDLTKKEKDILRMLNTTYASHWNGRVINMGYSTVANAWTDGHSFITLNRDFINGLSLPSAYGVARLVMVLIHEMAHDCNTQGSHIHGLEFYETFHDLALKEYGISSMLPEFRQKMEDKQYKWMKDEEKRREEKKRKKLEEKLAG